MCADIYLYVHDHNLSFLTKWWWCCKCFWIFLIAFLFFFSPSSPKYEYNWEIYCKSALQCIPCHFTVFRHYSWLKPIRFTSHLQQNGFKYSFWTFQLVNIFSSERVKVSSTACQGNSCMQILGVILTQRGLTIHFFIQKCGRFLTKEIIQTRK